jgi:hypothetical protein
MGGGWVWGCGARGSVTRVLVVYSSTCFEAGFWIIYVHNAEVACVRAPPCLSICAARGAGTLWLPVTDSYRLQRPATINNQRWWGDTPPRQTHKE